MSTTVAIAIGGLLLLQDAAPPARAAAPSAARAPTVSSIVSPTLSRTAKQSSAAATSLDTWLALHYRGAHLLLDTASVSPSLASSGMPPRIETVRAGAAVDSIWAVHFSATGHVPTFAVPATVRLTGPSGAVSPLAARVIARRPFRAPRVPSGSTGTRDVDSNWRQGWAYLAVVPHAATRNATRYRGWLLLGVPERAPSGTARSQSAAPRPRGLPPR